MGAGFGSVSISNSRVLTGPRYGYRFGGVRQSQGHPLGVGVIGRLSPGRHAEDALGLFTQLLESTGVHVDAHGAAVDLPGAQMLRNGWREPAEITAACLRASRSRSFVSNSPTVMPFPLARSRRAFSILCFTAAVTTFFFDGFFPDGFLCGAAMEPSIDVRLSSDHFLAAAGAVRPPKQESTAFPHRALAIWKGSCRAV